MVRERRNREDVFFSVFERLINFNAEEHPTDEELVKLTIKDTILKKYPHEGRCKYCPVRFDTVKRLDAIRTKIKDRESKKQNVTGNQRKRQLDSQIRFQKKYLKRLTSKLTPQLSPSYGWVTINHIETPAPPYAKPSKGGRTTYVYSNPFVEVKREKKGDGFLYFQQHKNRSKWREKRLSILRLKQDKPTFIGLFSIFWERKEINTLLNSDYCKAAETREAIFLIVSDYHDTLRNESLLTTEEDQFWKEFIFQVFDNIIGVSFDLSEEEHLDFFYYYIKNPNMFKKTVRTFANQFKETDLKGENLKHLLNLAFKVSNSFNSAYNGDCSTINTESILSDYYPLKMHHYPLKMHHNSTLKFNKYEKKGKILKKDILDKNKKEV